MQSLHIMQLVKYRHFPQFTYLCFAVCVLSMNFNQEIFHMVGHPAVDLRITVVHCRNIIIKLGTPHYVLHEHGGELVLITVQTILNLHLHVTTCTQRLKLLVRFL